MTCSARLRERGVLQFSQLHRLSTRLVLVFAALMTACIVAEIFFLAGYVRHDMVTQTSSQLTAITDYVAHGIHRDVVVRRAVLEDSARALADALEDNPSRESGHGRVS